MRSSEVKKKGVLSIDHYFMYCFVLVLLANEIILSWSYPYIPYMVETLVENRVFVQSSKWL
jgi:hypothetical protein